MTIEIDVSAEHLEYLSRFMAKGDVRYYLNGIRVEPHPDGAIMIATDGHTLCSYLDPDGKCSDAVILDMPKQLIAAATAKAASKRLIIEDGRLKYTHPIPAAPAVQEVSDVEALISEVARLSGAVCGAMKNWETIQARERRLLPLEQVLIAAVRLLGYWGAMAITVQSKDIISELYPLISNLKDAVFLVEIQVKNENSEAARVARIVEDATNCKQAPIHPASGQQDIQAVPDDLMKLFYSWWGNQINDSDYFNQMQKFFDSEKSNRMLAELSEQQDYPECSGDPASCPENEGYGCCKPNPVAQP